MAKITNQVTPMGLEPTVINIDDEDDKDGIIVKNAPESSDLSVGEKPLANSQPTTSRSMFLSARSAITAPAVASPIEHGLFRPIIELTIGQPQPEPETCSYSIRLCGESPPRHNLRPMRAQPQPPKSPPPGKKRGPKNRVMDKFEPVVSFQGRTYEGHSIVLQEPEVESEEETSAKLTGSKKRKQILPKRTGSDEPPPYKLRKRKGTRIRTTEIRPVRGSKKNGTKNKKKKGRKIALQPAKFEPKWQFQGKTYSRSKKKKMIDLPTSVIDRRTGEKILGASRGVPVLPLFDQPGRVLATMTKFHSIQQPDYECQMPKECGFPIRHYRRILPVSGVEQERTETEPPPPSPPKSETEANSEILAKQKPKILKQPKSSVILGEDHDFEPVIRFEGKTYSGTRGTSMGRIKAFIPVPPKINVSHQLDLPATADCELINEIDDDHPIQEIYPPQKKPKKYLPCRVCRSNKYTSVSRHYSIRLCRDCQRFLKRSLDYRWKNYICAGEGNCLINEKNRDKCLACRFQKFLKQGEISIEGFEAARLEGCQVCGVRNETCSVRYGRLSCYRCAEFFRVTIVEHAETFEKCSNYLKVCRQFNKTKFCVECRLKKCFDVGMTLVKNKDWIEKRTIIQQRFDTPRKDCYVCHKNRGHYQYGAIVCQPCVAFFRRAKNYVNDFSQMDCLFKNDCHAEMQNPGSCSSCRYRKCVKAGVDLTIAPPLGLPELSSQQLLEIEQLEAAASTVGTRSVHRMVKIEKVEVQPETQLSQDDTQLATITITTEVLPASSPCLICNHPTDCPAALACHWCRFFFQRTLRTCGWCQYQCVGGTPGGCSLINQDTVSCNYCRLKRCLVVGIRPSPAGDNFGRDYQDEFREMLQWHQETDGTTTEMAEEEVRSQQTARQLELCVCGLCR